MPGGEKKRGLRSFLVTFVYGYPDKQKRKSLWDRLNQIALPIAEPWVLLGDFNSVLSPDEKRGGRLIFFRMQVISGFYPP